MPIHDFVNTTTVDGSYCNLFLSEHLVFVLWKCVLSLHMYNYRLPIKNATCFLSIIGLTRLLKLTGCLPSSVIFPLMVAFAILVVYPAGKTMTFGCAAGFTLTGSATAMCSGTTFMFDDLTASCLSSWLAVFS